MVAKDTSGQTALGCNLVEPYLVFKNPAVRLAEGHKAFALCPTVNPRLPTELLRDFRRRFRIRRLVARNPRL